MKNMTTRQAAEYIGVAEGTLRYWRHRHEGPPSFRVGHRVLYRLDDLEAWITEQYESTVISRLSRHPP